MSLCRACGGVEQTPPCPACLGGALEPVHTDEEKQAAWECVREFAIAFGMLGRHGWAVVEAKYGQVDPAFFEAMEVFESALVQEG